MSCCKRFNKIVANDIKVNCCNNRQCLPQNLRPVIYNPENVIKPQLDPQDQILVQNPNATGCCDQYSWKLYDPNGDFNLFVNNTVFVDPDFGNDLTGLREDMTKPFKTLTAANTPSNPNAAQVGDTIYVRPGIYDENTLLLHDGINWYFEEGSTIENTSTNAIFTDSTLSNITSQITGFGNFTSQGSIFDLKNNTTLLVQGLNLESTVNNLFEITDIIKLTVNVVNLNKTGLSNYIFNITGIIGNEILVSCYEIESVSDIINISSTAIGNFILNVTKITGGAIINTSLDFVFNIDTQQYIYILSNFAIQIDTTVGTLVNNSSSFNIESFNVGIGGVLKILATNYTSIIKPELFLNSQTVNNINGSALQNLIFTEYANANISINHFHYFLPVSGSFAFHIAKASEVYYSGQEITGIDIISSMFRVMDDSTTLAVTANTIFSPSQVLTCSDITTVNFNVDNITSSCADSNTVITLSGINPSFTSFGRNILDVDILIINGTNTGINPLPLIDTISGIAIIYIHTYIYTVENSIGIRLQPDSIIDFFKSSVISAQASDSTVLDLASSFFGDIDLITSNAVNSFNRAIYLHGNGNMGANIINLQVGGQDSFAVGIYMENDIYVQGSPNFQGFISSIQTQGGSAIENNSRGQLVLIFNQIFTEGFFDESGVNGVCINLTGTGDLNLTGNSINANFCKTIFNIVGTSQDDGAQLTLRVNDISMNTCQDVFYLNSRNGGLTLDFQRINGNNVNRSVFYCDNGFVVISGNSMYVNNNDPLNTSGSAIHVIENTNFLCDIYNIDVFGNNNNRVFDAIYIGVTNNATINIYRLNAGNFLNSMLHIEGENNNTQFTCELFNGNGIVDQIFNPITESGIICDVSGAEENQGPDTIINITNINISNVKNVLHKLNRNRLVFNNKNMDCNSIGNAGILQDGNGRLNVVGGIVNINMVSNMSMEGLAFIVLYDNCIFQGYFNSVTVNNTGGALLSNTTPDAFFNGGIVVYRSDYTFLNHGNNPVIEITEPFNGGDGPNVSSFGGYMKTNAEECILYNNYFQPTRFRLSASTFVNGNPGNCINNTGIAILTVSTETCIATNGPSANITFYPSIAQIVVNTNIF